jgi:hypothetical protein
MVTSNVFIELHRPAYLQSDTTMCTPDKAEEVVKHLLDYLPPDELSWTITIKPTATVYYEGDENGD